MPYYLGGLLLFFLLIYGGILFYFYHKQESMIFFPKPIEANCFDLVIRYKESEVKFNHDLVELHGWFVRKRPHYQDRLLIYYGGNREEVSQHLNNLEIMEEYSFLFVNYRGYGKSTGQPSQKALFRDALFVIDHLIDKEKIPAENIVLFGRSLGSGIATYVASQRQVGAVILITPFDSLANVAKRRYPFLPVHSILKHPFDSLSVAPKITTPTLILLAEKDQVIPYQNSLNLINRWGGAIEHSVIEEMEHHNLHEHENYWDEILSFLKQLKNKEA